MGTAKRERQKANRQIRLEELAKEARRNKTRKVTIRAIAVALSVVALVGVVYLVGRDNSSSSVASTTTSAACVATTDSSGGPTTSAYVKPTVSLPATLPTSLVVTDLEPGTGPAAKAGDTVTVHYIGVLSKDGTVFDNSYDRCEPIPVTLGAGQVIPGWDQGLVGVKAGGRRQLDIPASLAYGNSGSGTIIKPGDAISFVIDVVSITPAATDTTTPGSTDGSTASSSGTTPSTTAGTTPSATTPGT